MVDRWTFIRRRAHDVLARYAAKTGQSAFQKEGGSYRVLKGIAEYGLDEFFLDMEDYDLSAPTDGEVSRKGRSISVRWDVAPVRKPLVAAHEMGHLALEHPARDFQCENSGQGADVIRDEAHHIEEQPHVSALSQQDKVPRAYRPRDRWELEANVFAAELLAPLHEVRLYIRNRPHWQLKDMADYFGLSKDAMRNQLVSAFIICPRPDFTENSSDSRSKRVELQSYLDLDDKQREAAKAPSPALIIAGPGAGKTRVLTARFVRLVREEKADPHRILALTFSNKAVAEMRQRLYEAFPDKEHEVQVFTFHSLGLELLSGYGGFVEPPIVLTDADAFVFLRSRLHELPLGHFRSLTNPTLHLDEIHKRINRLKELGISPQEFRGRVQKWQEELKEAPALEDEVKQQEIQNQNLAAEKCLDLAAIYDTYQRWLNEAGYVDYPDLINLTLRLFEDEKISRSICSNYDHILVDEFQDINHACGLLVKALNDGKDRVWAVADPRQSIYGFRGASLKNLARFQADYPKASIVTLDTNYRSVAEIVTAGDAVPFPEIEDNAVFHVPTLRSHRGPSEAPSVVHVSKADTWWSEIAEIVANIKNVSQTVPREDIAVLCRTGYQARLICEALEDAGIPTNWSGQPEEQEAFKDLMAVLLLADNRPLSLLRLTKKEEHSLSESDLQLILSEVSKHNNSLYKALSEAAKGNVAGVSDEGRLTANSLRKLSGRLRACPNAWNALAVYLFEETDWIRELLEDRSPKARRYLATTCQVLDLAREFAFKGRISLQADTKAFLDYIASTRETGTLPCPDSTLVIADAVNILTIHKSKGLEWPVVFVPDWEFQPYTRNEPVPLPTHLISENIDGLSDEEAFGRACLAYVAVTRAENQLWISHSSTKAAFLPEMVKRLGTEVETHTVKRSGWKRAYPPHKYLPYTKNLIPYSMIRQYGYCPKRAQYDYVYELRTESGGYLFFVRQLRNALSWLVSQQENGTPATPLQIVMHIDELWEQDRKPERRLSRFYKDQALQCARNFAARLRSGIQVKLMESWEWPSGIFRGREEILIEFKTDEWIEGNLDNDESTVVLFHRYDSPSERHLTDPLLALYLTFTPTYNDSPVEVRLHYLADGQEKAIVVDAGDDVFDREKGVMLERVEAIRNGYFPAKPKERPFCRRCPYNLICPT